jgi:two-component system, NarL family, sensor histidine kinase DegS
MEIGNKTTVNNLNFKKLKQMYIFALVTIAITVLLSQLLIQYNINSQFNDSRLINISGKQRMLSQKLVKQVLVLNFISKTTTENKDVDDLYATLTLWQSRQFALEKGDKNLNLPIKKSETVSQLYKNIKPNFDSIRNATKQFIDSKKSNSNTKENQKLFQTILRNERFFLSKMNEIVEQYEHEALNKITLQRNTEYAILAFTLLILLLEFLFIFKPTNIKIETIVSKLLSSERKAINLAYDTEVMSKIKEESVNELKSLIYAMENTLLYCRITNDGTLIHIGEKFAKLINYNAFITEKKFSKILTKDDQDQNFLDQIILDKQRTGWQGQFKVTKTDNEIIWLDLSMVPVSIKKGESELLIICFDITERKKAQKEVERLNIESSNEKINQQKIISSKIVENQENEQNRIAKEIHDGIGQMLTGLKFSLESIDLNNSEKAAIKIEYLKKLSLDIIKGVRTATFNLMPPELSDHGIVSSINKLTQELSKLTGKEILFYNKSGFNQRLDSLIEINIYRLTQEAINNAIKYAGSSHIIVQLSHSQNLLSINIDDNGVGFNPLEVEDNKNSESGMGLVFMKERVQYVNGRVFINSIIGEGTRITFNIPI